MTRSKSLTASVQAVSHQAFIMLPSNQSDPIFSSRQIKLGTLVGLRWLAILGQGSAVLFVWLVLGYEFPGLLCLALVGLSAWLNLYLHFQIRNSVRLAPGPATGLLAYDSAQLGGLLYLTGGLHNPFALLLLVPAVVSATMQPARYTIPLTGLIVLIATLLVFFHMPLPWAEATPPQFPMMYVAGIWLAILVTMLFLSVYAHRIAQEGHLLANALSATELILANEQHLTTLDGLATAAAHELGTPLSTIQLVAKELERELDPADPLHEDAQLLRSQAERCREILGKLRSLSGDDHANFSKMRLSSLISELVEPFELFDVEIVQSFPTDRDDHPVLWRNPGLMFGLGNLIENATDFAASRVEISAQWNERTLSIRIADDGPGFSDVMLQRLGDPYVASRPEPGQPDRSAIHRPDTDTILSQGLNGGGLGLGFFIAKTLLERTGGRVEISNRNGAKKGKKSKKVHKNSGAVVDIYWPRAVLETDQ
ncbi:ActS/PrrB/RegB family redox-sensitive histidine kinase [Cohaesibacter intestini]|uniref:ActS/PrrB/RegB family redox-sensitive histidine kinase n=1 Tax=Cohaesibacter intestini TaxID=2211145 RepID=UPI001FDFD0BC|nr:ActS/PrrB/RegB family redox-sensitive histidine kinase [Cohaesibacter intestini]